MESNADLSEEYFKILPTQARLGGVSHLLQGVAARHAGFGVYASEGEVIVLRLEVGAFLLGELTGEPSDDGYKTPVSNGRKTLVWCEHTVRELLRHLVNTALDPADGLVIVYDHLPAYSDRATGEGEQSHSYVALP